MLVLSRRETERIRLGDSIVVTVVRVSGDKVRLGIEAPRDVLVLREELEPHCAAGNAACRFVVMPVEAECRPCPDPHIVFRVTCGVQGLSRPFSASAVFGPCLGTGRPVNSCSSRPLLPPPPVAAGGRGAGTRAVSPKPASTPVGISACGGKRA